MNDAQKKLSRRPWWMINGLREPMGDIDRDHLVAERLRWAPVAVDEPEEERSDDESPSAARS